MGQIDLDFGDSITGLLLDYEDDTPYVGATLRLTQEEGVVVEVPYVLYDRRGHFSHVRRWFQSRKLPASLVLLTSGGAIGLFENRWRSYAETYGNNVASVGRFCPEYTVLGFMPESQLDDLKVNEVNSWIDGLNHWSPVSALREKSIVDERGLAHSLEIKTGSTSIMCWPGENAMMELRTTWEGKSRHDGYSDRLSVDGNVSLVSKTLSGLAEIHEHVAEHRKFKHFMIFNFGCQLSFRRHCFRDDRFAMRSLDRSRAAHSSLVEFLSSETIRERRFDIPATRNLMHPIAELEEIGVEGLEAWSLNYDEWERFILPSVNVLGRKDGLIEDSIISTCMSMEAAGVKIGSVEGEACMGVKNGQRNIPIAACIYRCLKLIDVKWPDRICGCEGLARSIADVYNSIKHADRGAFPDGLKVRVVWKANEIIVRMLAVHIAGVGDRVFPRYRNSMEFFSLDQLLSSYNCRIACDGTWEIGED